MVSISSPSALMEWMFCSSKYTSTSIDFNSRTVWSSTTVFRANREIDFVMMRSMFPARHSTSSRWNSVRFSFVPVSASSAYTPQ